MTDSASGGPSGRGIAQERWQAPPDATRLWLVRHGATEHAHPGRRFALRDGQGDPSLSAQGELQAELVCRRLLAEHHIEPFAAVYTTPLVRTAQTVAAFSDATGLDTVVDARLREVHLGEWEGGELRVRIAAGDATARRLFAEQRWDVLPGGEPNEQVAERLHEAVTEIAVRHRGRRVVLSSHGFVVGQLCAMAVGVEGFALAHAENASITELVVDGGTWRLQRFNDCAHLDASRP